VRRSETIAAFEPPAVALRVEIGSEAVADGCAVGRHPVVGEGKRRGEIGGTEAGGAADAGLEGIAPAAAPPPRPAPMGAAPCPPPPPAPGLSGGPPRGTASPPTVSGVGR